MQKSNFTSPTAPAQSPLPVTGRNVAHKPRSAGARAFLAADLIRGKVVLERPTITQACAIVGVSYPYVKAALEAAPAERLDVERGQRSFNSLYEAVQRKARKARKVAILGIHYGLPKACTAWDACWSRMDDAERDAWVVARNGELWHRLDGVTAATAAAAATTDQLEFEQV
jgi:hypothetical protein